MPYETTDIFSYFLALINNRLAKPMLTKTHAGHVNMIGQVNMASGQTFNLNGLLIDCDLLVGFGIFGGFF